MSQEVRYDAAVIGTGQGGKPLAAALAGAGYRTAILERDDVGGTCVNVGCTPTKTMVASARASHLAGRAAEYGVRTGPVEVDLQTVRSRKRGIVDQFRGGSEKSLERTDGLDLIQGEAGFAGAGALEIRLAEGGTSILRSDKIFINTGARTSTPPVEGLDAVPYLDSTSIMELGEVPEHLLVMGGGYVALEFAQMFRRFGTEVTVVQRGDQLLRREDPDIAEAIAGSSRDEGVEILLGTDATCATKTEGGISLATDTPDGVRELSGSHLLVATGRNPNTDSLNLDSAGIEANVGGFVQVNERLETSVLGVWALGDVNGGPAFTHVAYDDARILENNLLHGGQDRLPHPIHRPPARQGWPWRRGGQPEGARLPRGPHAHEPRGAGDGDGRNPRHDEGRRRSRHRAHTRRRGPRRRGWRADVDAPDRNDGGATIHCAQGRPSGPSQPWRSPSTTSLPGSSRLRGDLIIKYSAYGESSRDGSRGTILQLKLLQLNRTN